MFWHFLIIACTGVCAPSSASSAQRQLSSPSLWIASAKDNVSTTSLEGRVGGRPTFSKQRSSRPFILGANLSNDPQEITGLRNSSEYGPLFHSSHALFQSFFSLQGLHARAPPNALHASWVLGKNSCEKLVESVSACIPQLDICVSCGTLSKGSGIMVYAEHFWKQRQMGLFRAKLAAYHALRSTFIYQNVEVEEGVEYSVMRHNILGPICLEVQKGFATTVERPEKLENSFPV